MERRREAGDATATADEVLKARTRVLEARIEYLEAQKAVQN